MDNFAGIEYRKPNWIILIVEGQLGRQLIRPYATRAVTKVSEEQRQTVDDEARSNLFTLSTSQLIKPGHMSRGDLPSAGLAAIIKRLLG